MATIPKAAWQFLWLNFEPSENKQHRIEWDALAELFVQYLHPEIHDNTLNTVAGALTSLSNIVVRASKTTSSPNKSKTSVQKIIKDTNTHSQTSLVDSQDTQPIDYNSQPISSSPPTPPLTESANTNSSTTPPTDSVSNGTSKSNPPSLNSASSQLQRPEYRVHLTQFRALVCPCLVHMFPESPLRSTKFLVPESTTPAWYLKTLTNQEKKIKKENIPPLPSELIEELANTIRNQLVRRASSVSSVAPRESLDESRKTTSSIKHGSVFEDDVGASPSKRSKTANMTNPHQYTTEATHLRLLALENEQSELRREMHIMRRQLEALTNKLATTK